MVTYENECVGCPPHMGCDGDLCKYRHAPHLFCDECGDETNELYDYDGQELCEYCATKRFLENCSKVEVL